MVISRVIIRVTPFKALITLLITYLLSPLPLQVPGDSQRLARKHAKDRASQSRRYTPTKAPELFKHSAMNKTLEELDIMVRSPRSKWMAMDGKK